MSREGGGPLRVVVKEQMRPVLYASRPGIGRIELLIQTGGRVVPSYSYSCSSCCFSLSYSSDVNELCYSNERVESFRQSEFPSPRTA